MFLTEPTKNLDPAVHGMGAPQGVIVSDLIRAE